MVVQDTKNVPNPKKNEADLQKKTCINCVFFNDWLHFRCFEGYSRCLAGWPLDSSGLVRLDWWGTFGRLPSLPEAFSVGLVGVVGQFAMILVACG